MSLTVEVRCLSCKLVLHFPDIWIVISLNSVEWLRCNLTAPRSTKGVLSPGKPRNTTVSCSGSISILEGPCASADGLLVGVGTFEGRELLSEGTSVLDDDRERLLHMGAI